jgi:hypothetical protein
MLTSSLIVRCAFIGLALAGLVALAEGIVRYQLRQATSETTLASAAADAQPAGASDE